MARRRRPPPPSRTSQPHLGSPRGAQPRPRRQGRFGARQAPSPSFLGCRRRRRPKGPRPPEAQHTTRD
eukprot:13378947-Alexandrium_andersonii.AAC.1